MTAMENNAPIVHRIQKLIDERGVKQTVIAQKGGYTNQAFTDMMKGRKVIKSSDVGRLAQAFGVTPNDLFGETTHPPHNHTIETSK